MLRKVELIILLVLIAIIVALGISVGIAVKTSNSWKDKYEVEAANSQAYINNLHSAQNDVYQYSLTINDLRHLNDSISNKLLDLQKELNIKDRNINQLQYMMSHFERTDTVTFKDTIFISEELCIDTIVGDEWMSSSITFEYPSTIIITPSLKSEKSVMIYVKRETVESPKKTWIGRLFQRKHKVARVYVDEANPYIDNQQNEFIEVIRP